MQYCGELIDHPINQSINELIKQHGSKQPHNQLIKQPQAALSSPHLHHASQEEQAHNSVTCLFVSDPTEIGLLDPTPFGLGKILWAIARLINSRPKFHHRTQLVPRLPVSPQKQQTLLTRARKSTGKRSLFLFTKPSEGTRKKRGVKEMAYVQIKNQKPLKFTISRYPCQLRKNQRKQLPRSF